jgi:hypothetical protein
VLDDDDQRVEGLFQNGNELMVEKLVFYRSPWQRLKKKT